MLNVYVVVSNDTGFFFKALHSHVPAIGDTIWDRSARRTVIVTAREWNVEGQAVADVELMATVKES